MSTIEKIPTHEHNPCVFSEYLFNFFPQPKLIGEDLTVVVINEDLHSVTTIRIILNYPEVDNNEGGVWTLIIQQGGKMKPRNVRYPQFPPHWRDVAQA